MPTFMQIIHTLISRFLLILLLAVIIIPLFIFLLLPASWRNDNPIYYWLLDFFYRGSLLVTLLPIRYKGEENITQEAAVIVANHQSSLDISLVGSLLNRHPHVWLAKTELLESWIFRFWLPRMTVLVDMSSPLKGMRSLSNAITMVFNHKRHAVIFPEGTRHTDGSVHEFYAGFVILAKKTGRAVIPIRIFGANRAYPPETFWVRYHPITVVVGKPMRMEEHESDEAFKDRVYRWFQEQRED